VPSGYVRGEPDPTWWMQQIHAGIAFRKKYAKEVRWPVWRSYYRGNWKAGILPKNLFFMMIRTIVPRIYFRNPSVSVTAKKPGYEYLAMAQILERVDNKLIRSMRVKNQIKRIIQNSFMFGAGFGKLGYGAEFTPTPDVGDTEVPIVRNHRNEYRSGIMPNMPWFLSVHTGSIIVPAECPDWESSRFVAHWVKRPVSDVTEDPRLRNVKNLTSSDVARSNTGEGTIVPGIIRVTPMFDLVEIRDKMTGKVIVLAPYHPDHGKKVVYYEDDDLSGEWGPTIYPLIFNEDDEYFWGVPESVILEPYQLEINEIRTQTMKHRRLSMIKMMFEQNSIDPAELDKLLSEDVGAGVSVKDITKVKPMQVAEIPEDLIIAEQAVMQDVRESVGFGRNQFGEYKPGSSDTTATEAQIVKMASEIRVDERRDMVADLLVNMIEDMHRIIFTEWKGPQVVQVAGPAGVPIWVRFSAEALSQGRYDVQVDPDTSVPETKALREQRAVQVYGLLRTNPLIDPFKLTAYLLHELHGVQFDDMMRALPPGLGTQGMPVPMDQYAQLLAGMDQRLGGRLQGGGQ